MPLLDALSAKWDAARELYRLLQPVRFSFLTLLVAAAALHLTDQGKDAIAALAEGNATWLRWILFVLLIGWFALQTWYWSRQLLRVRYRGQPDPRRWPRTIRWIPRLFGLTVFLVVIASLARVRSVYAGIIRKPAQVLGWIIFLLLLEAAAFFLFVVIRRRRMGPVETVERLRDFGPVTLRFLGITAVLAVIVLLFSTFAVQVVGRMGAISVLIVSLGFWVALGGAVVHAGMRARIPILTWLVLFAILISPFAENHHVRTIEGAAPSRPDADAAFAAWYARLVAETPNAPTPRPVFLVSTEGGGVRAAYWTAAVLTSLHDTIPGFTAHTFAISGASGGSLGAATYRTLLAERSLRGALRPLARETLAHDVLAPTLAAYMEQDFVQRFLPLGFPDRAHAIEEGWELGWSRAVHTERFGKGFLATTTADADRFPSLFLNGTLVETGQRAIGSNVRIDNRFAYAADMFNLTHADVPMSTAVHNSSRFPFISPVGRMGDRHVADGGYFDNSGASTTSDLVDIVRRHPDYAKGLIRPYVIFIDCQPEEHRPAPAWTVANELIAPVLTFGQTYFSHGLAAVAEVREHMPPADRATFTLVQHRGERFPLGWLLAARTRDLIDKQMGSDAPENGASVRAIANVLGVTAATDPVYVHARSADQIERARERR